MGRTKRHSRPGLECLEDRQLLHARLVLHGRPINDQDLARFLLQKANNVPVTDRRIEYTTPESTHVIVTLFGTGSLAGSTIAPDGTLDLVYAKTDSSSGIVGRVSGGTQSAKLGSIRQAGVPLLDLSTSANSSQIGPVNLKDFDLVDGGFINLSGGVGKLFLRSMGSNAQIHLKDLPVATSSPSFGGASSSSSSTSGALGSATGVDVDIKHVNGAPHSTPALGDPQIFGYDPTANALIRFDATTGAALQTITLSGIGQATAGVALGRFHRALVVLVGNANTIQAFDAVTGNFVGQFSTANLASEGFNRIDGIGSTDVRTVVTDASAGTAGLAQLISVSQSLDSGQAVPIGAPFAPQREFEFSGGATGVAGSDTIYATGAAHFDSFQPNQTQFGIMAIGTGRDTLTELSRNAVTSPASIVNTGVSGTARANPIQALGSVDQNLALVTDNQNTVTLYNPRTLAVDGSVTLNDPNRLAGLSESFHPELVDAALVDVQGNLGSFRALDAQGLVINDSGSLGLVQINRASDSAIVGHPVDHVNIPSRQNVVILSTNRIDSNNMSIGTRGGVTINPNLPVMGPLSLP